MTEGNRRGLSPGCVFALVPVVLVALCVLVPTANFIWSVVQMNLHRDDFAAFNHIPPGARVSDVVDRAEALGFEREPIRGDPPVDGGPELTTFEKTVVPPFGRWFIHISHLDGGVVSVRTSTLD